MSIVKNWIKKTLSAALAAALLHISAPAAEAQENWVIDGLWNHASQPILIPTGNSTVGVMTSPTVTTGPRIESRRCAGTASGTYPNITCSSWTGWTTASSNVVSLTATVYNQIRLLSPPNISPGGSVSFDVRRGTSTVSARIGTLTLTRSGGVDDQPLAIEKTGQFEWLMPFNLRDGIDAISVRDPGATSGPNVQVRNCQSWTGTVDSYTCNMWGSWSSANTVLGLAKGIPYQARITSIPRVAPGGSYEFDLRTGTATTATKIGTLRIVRPAGDSLSPQLSGQFNFMRQGIQIPPGMSSISIRDSSTATTGPNIQSRQCFGVVSGQYPNQTCSSWSQWSSAAATVGLSVDLLNEVRLTTMPNVAPGGQLVFDMRTGTSAANHSMGSLTLRRDGGPSDDPLAPVISGQWNFLGQNIQIPPGMASLSIRDSATATTGPNIQSRQCFGVVSGQYPNQTCSSWSQWSSAAATVGLSVDLLNEVRLTTMPNVAPGGQLVFDMRTGTSAANHSMGSLTLRRDGGPSDDPLAPVISGQWNFLGQNIQIPPGMASLSIRDSATATTGPNIQSRQCFGVVSGQYPNQTCSSWSQWSSAAATVGLSVDLLNEVRLTTMPNVAPGGQLVFDMRTGTSAANHSMGSLTLRRDGGPSDDPIDVQITGIWDVTPTVITLPRGLNSIAVMTSPTVTTGPTIQSRYCVSGVSGTYPNYSCSSWSAWSGGSSNSAGLVDYTVNQISMNTQPTLPQDGAMDLDLRASTSTASARYGTVSIRRNGGANDTNMDFVVEDAVAGTNPVFTLRPGLTRATVTFLPDGVDGPQIQARSCNGTVGGTWPNLTCSSWGSWSTTTTTTGRNTRTFIASTFGQIQLVAAPTIAPGTEYDLTIKLDRLTTGNIIGSIKMINGVVIPEINETIDGLWSALNPITLPVGFPSVALVDGPSLTSGPSIQTRPCIGTVEGEYPNQTCSSWGEWTAVGQPSNVAPADIQKINQIRFFDLPAIPAGETKSYSLKFDNGAASQVRGQITVSRNGGANDEDFQIVLTEQQAGTPSDPILMRPGMTSAAVVFSASEPFGPAIEARTCTGTVTGSYPGITCDTWGPWSSNADPLLANAVSLPRDGLGQIRLASAVEVPGANDEFVLKAQRSTGLPVLGSLSVTSAEFVDTLEGVVTEAYSLTASAPGEKASVETVVTAPTFVFGISGGESGYDFRYQTAPDTWSEWNTTGLNLQNLTGNIPVEIRMTAPERNLTETLRVYLGTEERGEISLRTRDLVFPVDLSERLNLVEGLFIHNTVPTAAEIESLRFSRVDTEIDLNAINWADVIDPIVVEVPSRIFLRKNGVLVPTASDPMKRSAIIAEGDTVSLQIQGTETGFFGIDNTLIEPAAACAFSALREDCKEYAVTFISGTQSAIANWRVSRLTFDAQNEAKTEAFALQNFTTKDNALRGETLVSNTQDLTITGMSSVTLPIQIVNIENIGTALGLSSARTSLIINGEETDVRSRTVTFNPGEVTTVAIKSESAPAAPGEIVVGSSRVTVRVGDNIATWDINWGSVSPTIEALRDALNARVDGLGSRLEVIYRDSVAFYQLDPVDNLLIQSLVNTSFGRLERFLVDHPELTILSPREAFAIETATTDSTRPFGEVALLEEFLSWDVAFVDRLSVPLSSTVESNIVRLSAERIAPGIDAGDPVTIVSQAAVSGASFRTGVCETISTLPWSTMSAGVTQTAAVGDCIQLRLLSAATFSTLRQMVLSIDATPLVADDSVTAVWRVRTIENTPTISDFDPITNAAPNTLVASTSPRSVSSSDATGLEPTLATPIGEGNPEIRVSADNGATWSNWSTSGLIVAEGYLIEARAVAPTGNRVTRVVEVAIGNNPATATARAEFSITTAPGLGPDLSSDILGVDRFIDLVNQPKNELVISNEIIPTTQAGDSTSSWFVAFNELAEGGNPASQADSAIQINNGPWQTGLVQVNSGDRIRIRHRTGATELTGAFSELLFFDGDDAGRVIVERRTWNTTTAADTLNVAMCDYSLASIGNPNVMRPDAIFPANAEDPYQGPGNIHPWPSLMPGDEVAIDLSQLDTVEAWVESHNTAGAPTTRQMGIWTPIDITTSGSFNPDLVCDQVTDPMAPIVVQLVDYEEAYNADCCTVDENSRHAYPNGPAVSNPSHGAISTPPVGDVASRTIDETLSYLIVDGVPAGRAALVTPGQTVEVGLKLSEGMYRYRTRVVANGYAERDITLSNWVRPPLGDITRAVDLGDLNVLNTGGQQTVDALITIPEVTLDLDTWYPAGIRSLANTAPVEIDSPTTVALVPLNEYARAILDNAATADIAGETAYRPNLTWIDPRRTHESVMRGEVHNRKVTTLPGDELGLRLLDSASLVGPAEFGIFLPHYTDLPAGVTQSYAGAEPVTQDVVAATFTAPTVSNGTDPTEFAAAGPTFTGDLLAEFTLQPVGLPVPTITSFFAEDFVDVFNVPRSIRVESNPVTVSGFADTLPISVGPGSEFKINDGSWMTSGTVVDGDVVTLAHISSNTANTAVSTLVQIGGYSDTWQSTTGVNANPGNCFTAFASGSFVLGELRRGPFPLDTVGVSLFDGSGTVQLERDRNIPLPAQCLGTESVPVWVSMFRTGKLTTSFADASNPEGSFDPFTPPGSADANRDFYNPSQLLGLSVDGAPPQMGVMWRRGQTLEIVYRTANSGSVNNSFTVRVNGVAGTNQMRQNANYFAPGSTTSSPRAEFIRSGLPMNTNGVTPEYVLPSITSYEADNYSGLGIRSFDPIFWPRTLNSYRIFVWEPFGNTLVSGHKICGGSPSGCVSIIPQFRATAVDAWVNASGYGRWVNAGERIRYTYRTGDSSNSGMGISRDTKANSVLLYDVDLSWAPPPPPPPPMPNSFAATTVNPGNLATSKELVVSNVTGTGCVTTTLSVPAGYSSGQIIKNSVSQGMTASLCNGDRVRLSVSTPFFAGTDSLSLSGNAGVNWTTKSWSVTRSGTPPPPPPSSYSVGSFSPRTLGSFQYGTSNMITVTGLNPLASVPLTIVVGSGLITSEIVVNGANFILSNGTNNMTRMASAGGDLSISFTARRVSGTPSPTSISVTIGSPVNETRVWNIN